MSHDYKADARRELAHRADNDAVDTVERILMREASRVAEMRATALDWATGCDRCPDCGSPWFDPERPHEDDCEYIAMGGTYGVAS